MKKLVLTFGLFLTACSTSQPVETQEIETKPVEIDQQSFSGEAVSYFAEKEDIKGYLATPEGEGPFPAVILIHEWWGLNDNMRSLADKFSSEGYVALAVDLYEGQVTSERSDAQKLSGAVREDMEGAFANLNSAVSFLKGKDIVDPDSLSSVGWCFGGGWSYQMAKNNLGVKSSVIYYGFFNPEDDLSIMRANILGHFGEEDVSIKVDDVKAFEANLKTESGDHQVFIYSNAGHGFANEDNPNYDLESAEAAWERTLEFLSENVKE